MYTGAPTSREQGQRPRPQGQSKNIIEEENSEELYITVTLPSDNVTIIFIPEDLDALEGFVRNYLERNTVGEVSVEGDRFTMTLDSTGMVTITAANATFERGFLDEITLPQGPIIKIKKEKFLELMNSLYLPLFRLERVRLQEEIDNSSIP